jgi:hypothetical protein
MWGLIAAAIARAWLLCCWCRCLWREKRMQRIEEDEEEARTDERQAAKCMQPLEQAPLGPPPGSHLLRKTAVLITRKAIDEPDLETLQMPACAHVDHREIMTVTKTKRVACPVKGPHPSPRRSRSSSATSGQSVFHGAQTYIGLVPSK